MILPAENSTGANKVYEYIDEAHEEDRHYTISPYALPGFKPTGFALGFSAYSEPANDRVPIYASRFESTSTHLGRIFDTALSADAFEFAPCAIWDRQVGLEKLREGLEAITDASLYRMRETWVKDAGAAGYDPLTNPDSDLNVALGGGVDSATGTLTGWPLLEMVYKYDGAPPTTAYFGEMVGPVGSLINPSPRPCVLDSTEVFAGPANYVAFVQKEASANGGVAGVYDKRSWTEMRELYFDPNNASTTNSLTVLQGSFALFAAELTDVSEERSTDAFFNDALASLPPSIDENPEFVEDFIALFGTSVITSASQSIIASYSAAQ